MKQPDQTISHPELIYASVFLSTNSYPKANTKLLSITYQVVIIQLLSNIHLIFNTFQPTHDYSSMHV